MKKQTKSSVIFKMTFICGLFLSCQNEYSSNEYSNKAIINSSDKASSKILYDNRTITFDSRPNGTYTQTMANLDFGNTNDTWTEERNYISAGTHRITLLANKLTHETGQTSIIDIPDADSYEVSYNVKFHSQFEFARGGKIGWGFKLGSGNTGCNKSGPGEGGSARVMWLGSNKSAHFIPYIYHQDMPSNCGDSLGKRYPSSGSIKKGVWYFMKIYVKKNTGNAKNGRVKITIGQNGINTVLLDTPIQWTNESSATVPPKYSEQVNKLVLSVFRGGDDDIWKSDKTSYIYLDNVIWKKNPVIQ
jgi:hypothetical protein